MLEKPRLIRSVERADLGVYYPAAESFFAVTLKRETLPTGVDERFWHAMIEVATTYSDDRMVFRFKDGMEIER